MIVSRAFLEGYKANKLRAWLSENASIREIVDFQNFHVFRGIGIATAVVVLDTSMPGTPSRIRRLATDDLDSAGFVAGRPVDAFLEIAVDQAVFSSGPWSFVEKGVEEVCLMVDQAGRPLGDVLAIGQGMQTGRNQVFAGLAQSWIDSSGLQPGQYFIRARNSDISSFAIRDCGDRVLYLEDFRSFAELPPAVQSHLKGHERELKLRAAYMRGDCEWWKYTWPLHKELVGTPRLYCPYMAPGNRFAADLDRRFLGLTDTTVLYDAGQEEDLRYFVALLNSSLLSFRFRYIGKLKGGGVLEYFWNSLSKLSVRRIDFANARDHVVHDDLVHLVEQCGDTISRITLVRTDRDRDLLKRGLTAATREIDGLVYELYGIAGAEVALIEKKTGRT